MQIVPLCNRTVAQGESDVSAYRTWRLPMGRLCLALCLALPSRLYWWQRSQLGVAEYRRDIRCHGGLRRGPGILTGDVHNYSYACWTAERGAAGADARPCYAAVSRRPRILWAARETPVPASTVHRLTAPHVVGAAVATSSGSRVITRGPGKAPIPGRRAE